MLKTTATKMFANANSDSNETIARAKKQKALLANTKKDMVPFINVMRTLLVQNDHMSIINGYHRPMIYIHARGLESFKTGRIVELLQVLEAFGSAEGSEDWPSSINRDYKYAMAKFDVRLAAYVKEDSPTCRKVEVGTETQTVIKYAIQCD